MALTESTHHCKVGTQAPDFILPSPSDHMTKKTLASLKGTQGTVIMFVCNHCPFVQHIAKAIGQLADDYHDKGVNFIAINANDANAYPDDAPERMPQYAKDFGWHFPYLFDETQSIARAYLAEATPECYLFDDALKLIYHGCFDDASPNNEAPINGHALKEAIENLLKGKAVIATQKPSIGCNIKWRMPQNPERID